MGDEVGGKEPGHAGQHPGRIHVGSLVGDHERMHHRALALAGHDGHGPLHPGASGHGGLDLAQLHPVAAYLHLLLGVLATEELQDGSGPVAAHVPRPVPAPPVLDEGGGRLPRIAKIPVGQAPPADPQLAGHPVGAVEAVLAHDAEGLVGEGSAVGDRAPRRIDLPDLEVVRPYAGLGRAAHGHEQHPLGQLRAQTQRHPVAGDEGQPQTGRGPGAVVEHHVQQGGGRVPHRHAPGRDELAPRRCVAALLLVGQHDGGSEREGPEDVEHGEVEVKGRHAQDRISRPHAPSAHDIGDGVPRGGVAHRHPLRHPGGAGRVDHVGQRALGGAGGRGEGVGRLEAGQLGGVDAQGRARLFEDERRAGLGLGDADGDVRRPGGQHAQHGCHLAGPLREPDGHAVALAHAGGGEPPGDAQGAAGKLPVGRLAVGSPPQRRGIRLGLGAGEEPSVERPAAEVGPLRVRLGARRALRRGQQVGERLRPV